MCPVAFADSVGKTVAPFVLPDGKGGKVRLDDFKDRKAVVVLFLGTHCPINNSYLPRLNELQKAYAEKGVQFLAINSNHHDDLKSIQEHAAKHKITFPVLRDEAQIVADRIGAERVPEAFLLDAKGVIRYQGRIDDQFGIGYTRPAPTRKDLVEALDELLADKAISKANTEVAGCYITRAAKAPKAGAFTYTQHVSRIIQNRCQECHRPGRIGPMPLKTYEDASSWAAMIHEVVTEKRMPPWSPDPAHGAFANDRSLTKEERETLLAWINDGCPKGDEKHLPPERTYPEGWAVGTPDAIFQIPREFHVPADTPKGGIRYQYFVVPTNFKEDMWVQAVEAKPGNRAVVHHILIYIAQGTKRVRGEDGIGNGFLVAFVPGDAGVRFKEGMAKKIPKGSSLIFQMHYTPNGVAQSDRSSVGLVFAKKPPKMEMLTRAVAQNLLFIPPGAQKYRAQATSAFKKDALIYSLNPHMHLRGSAFDIGLIYPDGKKEKLLSVPKYDFNWQDTYILKEPLRVPAGTRVECIAHFDNSKNNLSNPDPTKWVRWGDQTWEEMMIGFVDYAYVEAADTK